MTGHTITFPALLGGITRDETGKIIAARSLISVWMTHVNFSMVNMDETGNSAGTSFWVRIWREATDKPTLALIND